ncbi:hypothetical protein HOY82DRAFT_544320 [Tuber indicum]|nr:hypothetical protein HOY82DRAFT_544320 [Tuber indicum]
MTGDRISAIRLKNSIIDFQRCIGIWKQEILIFFEFDQQDTAAEGETPGFTFHCAYRYGSARDLAFKSFTATLPGHYGSTRTESRVDCYQFALMMAKEPGILRTRTSKQRISKFTNRRCSTQAPTGKVSIEQDARTDGQPSRSATHHNHHIAVPRYFQGLNIKEGIRLMDSIKREFQEFLQSLNETGSAHHASDELEEPSDIEMVDDIAAEKEVDDTTGTNDGKQQEYQKHRVEWGKKNWGHIFEQFDKYEGDSTLTVAAWSRLLEWFWSTLSDKHMSELQGILQRIRTRERRTPFAITRRANGTERMVEQQELIRTYTQVVRLENVENLTLINQRLWLVALYENHTSYSEMIRGSGKTLQQRQHQVNKFIYQILNSELKIKVTMQTIKNHIKEGRHWCEMLHAAETRSFGYGLLLLLPVHGYKDVARKTSNPVWSFLLHQIPRMSRRVIDLAKAFHPIMKAIPSEGNGSVTISLLGYELMVPIDLHEASANDFDTCIRSYPKLDITATLNTIQRHGRLVNPHSIEEDLRKRRKRYRGGQHGSSLAAVNYSQETSDEEESEDQMTASEDDAEQSSSTKELEEQSTLDEDEGLNSGVEEAEHANLTINEDNEVQSTAVSTGATTTQVESGCLGISIAFAIDSSANNTTSNQDITDTVVRGSMILKNNFEDDPMNEQAQIPASAINAASNTTSIHLEEFPNQPKSISEPVIQRNDAVPELDTEITDVVEGIGSDTDLIRIEDTIPEMSEIIERSWNEIAQDLVENDEDIMQDL